MQDIFNYIGAGGFAAVLICVFVEITPIKINPIQWFGNLLNKGILDNLKRVENKLDNHIVQDYRNIILTFQRECLRNERHTLEQFKVAIEACSEYEKYIEQNNLKNGVIEEAILYIKRVYQKCLDNHDFIEIESR